MNYEFMRQVAPLIAIPPDEDGGSGSQGSWITPEQGNDQPLYGGADSNGERMPLPYIRDQGGPTQYYSPSGTAGLSTVGPPVPAVARSAPTPIQGIRGTTPDAPINPNFNIPGRQTAPQVTPPNDLMSSRPAPVWGLTEMHPNNMPPGPNGPRGQIHVQQAPVRGTPRYGGHGTQIFNRIPPEGDTSTSRPARPQVQGNLSNNMERYDQMVQQSGQNGGNTLFDMFDQAGFRPPQFLLDLTGRGRTMGEEVGRTGAQPTAPVQDVRGRQPEVQRTNQQTVTWNGQVTQVGPDQQVGRAEEVAAMLRANGIRVTSVYRQNNSRHGGHDARNSIDVDPRQQRRAQELINQWYPGLATELIPVAAGQDFGDGVVSSGEHGHLDLGPVAGPRRRR